MAIVVLGIFSGVIFFQLDTTLQGQRDRLVIMGVSAHSTAITGLELYSSTCCATFYPDLLGWKH